MSKQLFRNRVNLGLIGRVSSCHSSHSGLSPYAEWNSTHKPSDTLLNPVHINLHESAQHGYLHRKTTGNPRPQSRSQQLDTLLDELKHPTSFEETFRKALLDLNPEAAKTALINKTLFEYTSEQIHDLSLIEDARLDANNTDLNNYFAYIMENLDAVIKEFNSAVKQFPTLWEPYAKEENIDNAEGIRDLLEPAQTIADGIRFYRDLCQYFAYPVAGEHAASYSRNRALPVSYNEIPHLPSSNDWQLRDVIDAARLFSYRAKPGQKIVVAWPDSKTLAAEDEAFTTMFETLGVSSKNPNLQGKEIDVYEYWANA